MNKLRSKPPITSADDFIAGAERRAEVTDQARETEAAKRKTTPSVQKGRGVQQFPWDDPIVRDDVLKIYNVRLPEPYLLKLKYIAERTPGSMHQFCIDVLLPAIDKKVKELTG